MSHNAHDHYQALRFRNFRLLLIDGTLVSTNVVDAYAYYVFHRGTIFGTAQRLIKGLAMAPAYAIADRYNRKHVVIRSQLVGVLTALGFAGLSHWQGPVVAMYGCLLVMGIGEAFHDPASHALLANVIPADAFENSASWSNGFGQLASIVGPALGGLIVATFGGTTAAYVLNALAMSMGIMLIGCIHARPQSRPAPDPAGDPVHLHG